MSHLISQNYYYEDLHIQNVNERKYHIMQLIMCLCVMRNLTTLSVLITYPWLLAGDLILVLLLLPFAPILYIRFTTMPTPQRENAKYQPAQNYIKWY